MLFLKHRNKKRQDISLKKADKTCLILSLRSLQAQIFSSLRKRKRASDSASCAGSATVETVLVFPIFLCVMCGFLLLGNLLLTEGKIQFAVSKTADVYAMEKAVKETSRSGVVDMLNAQVIFSSFYESSDADKNYILGGRAGIVITASEEKGDVVKIQAMYRMRIGIPFIGSFSFQKKATGTQRIYTGYVEHEGDGNGGDDQLVYVAKNGTVYHTSMTCTHICLSISGESVNQVLSEHKYKPCERCIKNGEIPSSLYVTVYGEKYHSSLSCSGLKRTIRAVKKSEVPNLRMCSRCAAASGG